MEISEVRDAILAVLPDAQIEIDGEGCNFSAIVVSNAFEGLLPVKRQQKVYAGVQQWLTSGALHALSLKTYTPGELEQARASNAGGLTQLG